MDSFLDFALSLLWKVPSPMIFQTSSELHPTAATNDATPVAPEAKNTWQKFHVFPFSPDTQPRLSIGFQEPISLSSHMHLLTHQTFCS